jgi:hypothetical protein
MKMTEAAEVTEFRLQERNGNIEFWGVGPAYGHRGAQMLEQVPVNARREKALESMRKMGRDLATANSCPFVDHTA